MSIVQVVGPVIVGRISPALVVIENVSVRARSWRRRYSTASRAPLPDSSASDPSGLKMRNAATKPGSSVAESSSTPSEPMPVWGAHSLATRGGVSSKGRSSCSRMT